MPNQECQENRILSTNTNKTMLKTLTLIHPNTFSYNADSFSSIRNVKVCMCECAWWSVCTWAWFDVKDDHDVCANAHPYSHQVLLFIYKCIYQILFLMMMMMMMPMATFQSEFVYHSQRYGHRFSRTSPNTPTSKLIVWLNWLLLLLPSC